MSAAPLTRFSWEIAVAGPDGPPSSTMRLVLIVIGMHCRRKGSLQCWPSIRALEAATRLSQRSVIDQIEGAVAQGWLLKHTGQTGTMRRRGSIYTLTVPTAERHSAVSETVTAERASAVSHRQPLNVTQPTAERDNSQPLNVVPSLLTSEVRRNIEGGEVEGQSNVNGPDFRGEKPEGKSNGNVNGQVKGQGALQEKGHTLETWAEANGITRSSRETEDAYRRRAIDAFVKSKAATSAGAAA